MPAYSPGLLAEQPLCSRWGAPGEDRAGVDNDAGKRGPRGVPDLAEAHAMSLLPQHTELDVIGAGLTVRLPGGDTVPFAHLDYAASAPCVRAAADAVEGLLPWYGSVHRGAGVRSRTSTLEYERARDIVAGFVGARPGDAVVFTRNTTDALNLLARCLPRRTSPRSSSTASTTRTCCPG
nr:hypothetical protein GCM10020092_049020 [Actinoplanes digitatis]